MDKSTKAEIHDIFQGIKSGKKEAIEKLYKKYQKLVINISFSIVKDKHIAEEVSQIVFLKILQNPKENLPNSNELSWLYATTKNQTIDYLRKQRNIIDIDSIYDVEDNYNEINETIDKHTYRKMIEGLDPIDKEIVSLKVISYFTFKEIGLILGMPTGTVQWRYYKAVHALKMLLSNVSMFIISIFVTLLMKYNENSVKPNNNINHRTYEEDNWSQTFIPNGDSANAGNMGDEYSDSFSKIINGLKDYIIPIIFLVLVIIFAIIFIKRQQKRKSKSSK